MSEGATVSDLKRELHRKLQAGRAVVLSKLEGLSEYEMRRPMTPTGDRVNDIWPETVHRVPVSPPA